MEKTAILQRGGTIIFQFDMGRGGEGGGGWRCTNSPSAIDNLGGLYSNHGCDNVVGIVAPSGNRQHAVN